MKPIFQLILILAAGAILVVLFGRFHSAQTMPTGASEARTTTHVPEVSEVAQNVGSIERATLDRALDDPELVLSNPSDATPDMTIPAEEEESVPEPIESAVLYDLAQNELVELSTEQLVGSQRVYFSHESLRKPEIADPDSPENALIRSFLLGSENTAAPAGRN